MAGDTYEYTPPGAVEEPGPTAVIDYYVAPEDPVDSSTGDSSVIRTGSGSYFWTTSNPQPDPDVISVTAEGINRGITAMQPGDPYTYVFGRTTVTPKIIYAVADGDYLYVDYFVSAGECNQFISLTQGGEDIGLPATSDYEFFTGTSGQAASTLMVGVLGAYQSLPNVCHFVVKLSRDDSMDFRVVLEGLKLFDPRPSPQTTSYSTNPALAFARVMTDAGYTMDWDSVAETANYCDELITAISPAPARWTFNMPIFDRRNISTWVSVFSQYAHCFVDILGGQVRLVPKKPITTSPIPSKSVTSEDFVAGSAKTSRSGLRDTPKQVIVSFRKEDGTQRSAIAGTGDAGEKTRVQLPGINTYGEAKRAATEILNSTSADIRHEHTAYDEALSDTVGDVHAITYAPHNLSNTVMQLIGLRELSNGRWRRNYAEYADNQSDDDFTEPTTTEPDLPTQSNVPNGPTPTLTEISSQLEIEFTCVSWPYATDYLVIVYRDGVWENFSYPPHLGAGETVTFFHNTTMVPGSTYTVKVWVRNGRMKSVTPGEASLKASKDLLTTTAVEIEYTGLGTDGYYRMTPYTAESPAVNAYSGLIQSTTSTDYYDDFTVVFCIQPKDMGTWDIIVTTGYRFYITFDSTTALGQLLIGSKDKNGNSWYVYTPVESPEGGPCNVDQWAAVMISSYVDRTVSPIQKKVKIMVNGIMVFDGVASGTGHDSNATQVAALNDRIYFGLGLDTDATTHHYFSYCWADDTYLDPDTKWSEFFDGNNKPYDLGADGSNVTGTQPHTYVPDGRFDNNKGLLPNWAEMNTVSDAPSSPSD